jgi:ribosomal protein RSM22 (predicted rRNA methylase)
MFNSKQWNLLSKQQKKKDLNYKDLEFFRTLFCKETPSKMRCPICLKNRSVFLTKKINQCKFKFRCDNCKFTFLLVIEPHQILCDNCRGSGRSWKISNNSNIVNIVTWETEECGVCKGKGNLDWCSRVTRAKEIHK